KKIKMIFSKNTKAGLSTETIDVETSLSDQFCINDQDIHELARYAVAIESHYKCPMDIEWGKNGLDGKIYILQARPETVKSQNKNVTESFKLKEKGKAIVAGRAVTQKIGIGPVRIVNDPSEMHTVQPGDVLVADMTDPNWEPVMKRASALVTNRGGRTCHAAIIARELGIPAIVGSVNATELLEDGNIVTVSCSEGETGIVYQGELKYEVTTQEDGDLPSPPVKLMMNVGSPDMAFTFAQIPNNGVGLARLEFVINNMIGIHPKAIINYKAMPSEIQKVIDYRSRGYSSPKDFYINKICEGVATIASAFHPNPVIVRTSDFKSNEYKKLVAGDIYEPDEENPMIGFRGAARYISNEFKDCFALECEAMLKVRNEMGLTNVELMIPFVRTLDEAKLVISIMAENGLKRGENGLRLIMMCEVPSNAILAEEFLNYFDGFSIGSNDLTQLTLGMDRDSGILADGFDERNPAVTKMIEMAINGAVKSNKYIGICGQGPSDHPDFADWLVKKKISSLSLNPDTVISTWKQLTKK
ncbi:MAG: phosphoenolpyruvate synthase, partial [Methylophilaceae bacterium]|nr:phosphoenolpyruvate synthase [Methylophilaceae bacterium]